MKLASLSNGKSKVVFQIPKENSGYCNYKRVGLDTRKLMGIGWVPSVKLLEGLKKTIRSMDYL